MTATLAIPASVAHHAAPAASYWHWHLTPTALVIGGVILVIYAWLGRRAVSKRSPLGLWEFLAAARDDVLALAAEVRWLRAELDACRAWDGLAADSRRYALLPAGSEATA